MKHAFLFWFICRFDIPEDREKYFDHATRSRIVNFILRRKSFSKAKEKAYSFGRFIIALRIYKFWTRPKSSVVIKQALKQCIRTFKTKKIYVLHQNFLL